MARDKIRSELESELQDELDNNDGIESRVELLLLQLVRLQKQILAELVRQGQAGP